MIENIKFDNNLSMRFDIEKSALGALRDAVANGSRIGVACSGGADSVFLLFLVRSLCGAKNARNIRVLHFNHKARPNAELDEKYVRQLCEKLGLELLVGYPESKLEKDSEDGFRRMRMKFFTDAFAAQKLALIAQGHNMGDVAETVLMRLMRGVGGEGLCAPRAISNVGEAVFARPMLGIKKCDICAALKRAKIEWREDESNAESKFFRNRIRNELMPKVAEISIADFFESAKRTHDLLAEDAEAIATLFEAAISRCNENPSPDALALSDEILSSAAFVRRAVLKLLAGAGIADNMRAGAIDSAVERIASRASVSFKTSAGDGKFLHYDAPSKSIMIENVSADFEIPLQIGKNILPDGAVLTFKKITLSPARKEALLKGENDDSQSVYLETSAAGTFEDGALVVRNKRDGDAYVPMGSRAKKRIKDIFIAKKIPSAKRNAIPLVCNKLGDILWGVGLPPCDKFKMKNSSIAIELTYTPAQS